MSRKFGIFLIFIALFPILLIVFYPGPVTDLNEGSFSEEDKEKLVLFSYEVLDSYFSKNKTISAVQEPLLSFTPKYDVLFITLLENGSVRGCQSGSHVPTEKNRLVKDIQEATIEAIQDPRFNGPLMNHERSNTTVMFTFLSNASWVYNTSRVFLQNSIELGVHSIGLIYNNTPTIFKESVPITNNYDLEFTLNRLCEKANLDELCYQGTDVDLFRYDTLTFYGGRKEKVTTLYRYNQLVTCEEIANERINQSIFSGYQWFLNQINNQTNLLNYWYFPSTDEYASSNNHLRQLASLWAITESKHFFNSTEANDLINNTLNYYLQFQNQTSNFSCLLIDGEANLGSNAFLLLSLINTPNFHNQQQLIDEFAQGILYLQQDNGSFNTYFFSEKNTGVDYYPGEAMLSLMHLFKYTRNQRYVSSVQQAFPYYQSYWREHKNTAFVPWHTQTYAMLYEYTENQEILDFVFEMNDWMIENYYISDSIYPDEIGGFPKFFPTFSTSVFLEGINDAYYLARQVNDSYHIKKYHDVLVNGTRFILQTQFTKNNSFYLDHPELAIGGFRTSLTDNSLRIDNTQHALFALMKTYRNNIF